MPNHKIYISYAIIMSASILINSCIKTKKTNSNNIEQNLAYNLCAYKQDKNKVITMDNCRLQDSYLSIILYPFESGYAFQKKWFNTTLKSRPNPQRLFYESFAERNATIKIFTNKIIGKNKKPVLMSEPLLNKESVPPNKVIMIEVKAHRDNQYFFYVNDDIHKVSFLAFGSSEYHIKSENAHNIVTTLFKNDVSLKERMTRKTNEPNFLHCEPFENDLFVIYVWVPDERVLKKVSPLVSMCASGTSPDITLFFGEKQ